MRECKCSKSMKLASHLLAQWLHNCASQPAFKHAQHIVFRPRAIGAAADNPRFDVGEGGCRVWRHLLPILTPNLMWSVAFARNELKD
jgi:hypothetical protein